MAPQYNLALHIFRRDLRLTDNTALITALKHSAKVIPCFIFDERQITHNTYKSEAAIAFMCHSLQELDTALQKYGSRLYIFYGKAEQVIQDLLGHNPIQAIFINRDYTPFSRKRDQKIKKICDIRAINLHVFADALLHEPEEVQTKQQTPYTVFTPFYKSASLLSVNQPVSNRYSNYYTGHLPNTKKDLLKQLDQTLAKQLVMGGVHEAATLLKKVSRLNDYAHLRNFPAINGTTHLSAHLKFGTISVRTLYHTIIQDFGGQHELIKELYWRDFFTHIGFHYPHVFGESFRQHYDRVQWADNSQGFQAWCHGKTGFPIVDAGMRELNQTGYMHNRVRMITASFLTKDLHIDWRKGEKYFAQHLVDYDPAVNNGNWQWVASTGCDAQPYFRVFNPWLQQKKFDPECTYIKTWLPELANVPVRIIHRLEHERIPHYPAPIVNHKQQASKAIQLFKSIK